MLPCLWTVNLILKQMFQSIRIGTFSVNIDLPHHNRNCFCHSCLQNSDLLFEESVPDSQGMCNMLISCYFCVVNIRQWFTPQCIFPIFTNKRYYAPITWLSLELAFYLLMVIRTCLYKYWMHLIILAGALYGQKLYMVFCLVWSVSWGNFLPCIAGMMVCVEYSVMFLAWLEILL